MRNILFMGRPEFDLVVSNPIWYDATIFMILGLISFALGTWLFSSKEGNK